MTDEPINEDAGTRNFDVRVSGAVDSTFTADVSVMEIVNGRAQAIGDGGEIAVEGLTVPNSIGAGGGTASLPVTIIPDTNPEDDREFEILLINPTQGTWLPGMQRTHRFTIAANDNTVEFSGGCASYTIPPFGDRDERNEPAFNGECGHDARLGATTLNRDRRLKEGGGEHVTVMLSNPAPEGGLRVKVMVRPVPGLAGARLDDYGNIVAGTNEGFTPPGLGGFTDYRCAMRASHGETWEPVTGREKQEGTLVIPAGARLAQLCIPVLEDDSNETGEGIEFMLVAEGSTIPASWGAIGTMRPTYVVGILPNDFPEMRGSSPPRLPNSGGYRPPASSGNTGSGHPPREESSDSGGFREDAFLNPIQGASESAQ